ncbi:MAG: NHL repeat-containing protein, partial [Acidobacteria bacterium]|nr:NHL repeat-containing protein [Acidobacteriota bacterium]
MGRPHALLRVGFPYDRTLGMRRLTMTAYDVAIGSDGHLFILGRGGFGITYVRHLTLEDEDVDGFNLIGFGPGAAGADRMVDGGRYVWPQSIITGDDGNLWLSDEGTHRVSVLTTDGELVSQWGEFGNEPGQMNRPSGIAHDPDGNVYLADTLNHRVQKFTDDGKFLSSFGEYGSGDGQFDMPWGIDVDELGDIFVSDWRNDRVQKFSPDGEFVFSFGRTGSADGEFNRPSGVTIDKDGDIYVADWANHRVQLFDQTGRFVEKFTGDATLGRQARDYMITNLVALRLREMTSLEPQKRLRWPTSVRTDREGRMYIADYGS